jgi:hypothetical protein
MPPVARNVPGAILVAVLCGLAWMFGGGFSGLLYLLLYVAATVPGLPLGFALFGRDHAAGWIGGALIGYALTAVAVATAVELKIVSAFALLAVWAVVAVATWAAARRLHALAALPAWTRRDTAALLLTLLIVPAIVAVPTLRGTDGIARISPRTLSGTSRCSDRWRTFACRHPILTPADSHCTITGRISSRLASPRRRPRA